MTRRMIFALASLAIFALALAFGVVYGYWKQLLLVVGLFLAFPIFEFFVVVKGLKRKGAGEHHEGSTERLHGRKE